MVLNSDIATFPIGFRFYVPNPVMSAWGKKNKALKESGVAASLRPKASSPEYEKYPQKQTLALSMLKYFVDAFPDIKIKSVLADALYGTRDFMDKASSLTHGAQVISQLRSNQCVLSKN
jgi:hypothetical protein